MFLMGLKVFLAKVEEETFHDFLSLMTATLTIWAKAKTQKAPQNEGSWAVWVCVCCGYLIISVLLGFGVAVSVVVSCL